MAESFYLGRTKIIWQIDLDAAFVQLWNSYVDIVTDDVLARPIQIENETKLLVGYGENSRHLSSGKYK